MRFKKPSTKPQKIDPEISGVKNQTSPKSTKKVDWLSWAILVSAVLLGGFFVLYQAGLTLVQILDSQQQVDKVSQLIEYNYNVQNETTTPHQVYADSRQAFLDGDVDKVLELLHPSVRDRYEPGLRQAEEEGILHEAVDRMVPLTEIVYEDDFSVVYATEPIPGNDSINPLERYNETVEFTLDRRGFWKISSI